MTVSNFRTNFLSLVLVFSLILLSFDCSRLIPTKTELEEQKYFYNNKNSLNSDQPISNSINFQSNINNHNNLSTNHTSHSEEEDDEVEESFESTVGLIFTICGLAVGIIVTQLLSNYTDVVPYTCVLFLFGIVFSVADTKAGALKSSIDIWESIDANLLLFVFFPPLLFGEAMSLNWYQVKGGFMQSFILGGPGVLFGGALMGLLTKYILHYNWSWDLAMTFGSILTANDTVEILALLRRAGASPKMTILVVGESLINDGTAVMMFSVFYRALNGEEFTPASVITFFVETGFVSVALGILFGFITVRWLKFANRPLKEVDVQIQAMITICISYIVFYVAEYFCHVSGVLACCGAGVIVAWLGPSIILSHETMHRVWSLVEWTLNTILFLLVGLIIGNKIVTVVDAVDWAYVIILYIVLMLVRAVMIAFFFPLLSRIGHRFTLKEACFLAWAGLRGAVAMALALLVQKNCHKDIQDETSRMFFYVAGITALSLLINATTARSLLIFLNLVGTDSAEKKLVKRRLKSKVNDIINDIVKQSDFREVSVNEIRESCSLLMHETQPENSLGDSERDELLLVGEIRDRSSSNESDKKSHNLRTNSTALSNDRSLSQNILYNLNLSGSRNDDIINARYKSLRKLLFSERGDTPDIIKELLAYVRSVFLEIVRVQYWQNIEAGKLPRQGFSAQFLLYTIDVGLDNAKEESGARDWVCLESEIIGRKPFYQFLTLIEDYLPFCFSDYIAGLAGKLEALYEKRAVYMLTAFIEAHEHAQKKIHSFIGFDDEEDVDRSGSKHFQTPEEIKVVAESKKAVNLAKQLLDSIPEKMVLEIRSKQACFLVLAKEAEMVRTMIDEGLLTPKQAEDFLEEIIKDHSNIEKRRKKMNRVQAESKAKERKLQKTIERNSGTSERRSSLSRLSFWSEDRQSYDRLNDGLLE